MKNNILGAGLAMGLAVAGMAAPTVAEIPLTINLGGAVWDFNSDLQLQNTETPWVGLELAITDNWAAEFSHVKDNAESKAIGNTSTAVSYSSLGMKYYAGSYSDTANVLRPYVAFGVGILNLDPEPAALHSESETAFNGGMGVRWMITPRFGATLDARLVYAYDSKDTSTIASAGLNYYFGKVTSNVAAAAPAPAPLDSDGDGVTDDKDQCPGTPAGTRVDAKGCPLPVARVASIKLKVNFAFDSTAVQEKYFTDLGELAKFLKRFDELQVKIEGHTDSVGPDTYNQNLSQRRAQAVVDTLVKQYGIDAKRLQAIGYGESNPVASNDSAEGRAENRRVMASLEVEYED